ncbi:MAG TPA: protein kinase, partial [Byssovorax sp.]
KGKRRDQDKRKDRESKRRARLAESGRKAKADTGVVIKITDFGIAKILDAQGVTSTGQVLGSPAHMAPEQIEGGDVDARTDVFALGVLLYECLVGHLPFEGKNPAQVLRKVLDGIYPAADRERATVGGRWSRVVAGTLERDAAARTPTPHALAEQIEAELAAVGFGAPHAEIEAYFADPAGYASALVERLVPKLIARGEAARRAGDIPGAAADFNRALALKPNDLALLKRASGLATSTSRRVLLKRAAAVLAFTVAAGSAAFGIARVFKSGPAPRPVASAADTGAATDTQPVADDAIDDPLIEPPDPRPRTDASGAATAPAPHGSGHPRAHVRVSAPPASAAAVADASAKNVTFNVYPPGAHFFLDGREASWGGATFPLKPGPHVVKITVEGPCCVSPHEQTIQVDAARDAQQFTVHPAIHPATVHVRGPAGGRVLCTNNLAVSAGQSATIPMTKVALPGVSCTFTSPDGFTSAKRPIDIVAGKTTDVDWPL